MVHARDNRMQDGQPVPGPGAQGMFPVYYPLMAPPVVDGQRIFVRITRQSYWHRLYVTVQQSERRTRYLVTNTKRSAALLLLCRNGLTRMHIEGYVVEASLGWEETSLRKERTRTVTIYRLVNMPTDEDLLTLDDILRSIPRCRRNSRSGSGDRGK